MFNFGRRIITVTFFDQSSGRIISSSRMPLERLPETFAVDTELKMAGATFMVVRAEPATKPEFAATKQLKVVVRRH
jgi:hypothetical protein